MGMKMCFEFQSSLFLLRQFYMHLVGHWAHWRHFLTVRSQSLNYLVENACLPRQWKYVQTQISYIFS